MKEWIDRERKRERATEKDRKRERMPKATVHVRL
jgi:hypothetical protein